MRGLTRFEVEILRDAASPDRNMVPWSPSFNDTALSLARRRLISIIPCDVHESHGAITSLGSLVLSIATSEPSLIRP